MKKAAKRLLVALVLILILLPCSQVSAKEKGVYIWEGIEVKKQGDYWYYILPDKSGAVVCAYEGKSVNAKIPKKLGGKKVTVIESFLRNIESITYLDNGLYLNNSKVKSIVIPDSVTIIKDRAFMSCKKLEKVTLPKKLKYLGCDAFSECKNLKSISIPDGVTSIRENTFEGCRDLKSIELPNKLETIGMAAFSECTSLTKIDLPDSLTYIGDFAFEDCSNLKRISIPDGIKNLNLGLFRGCKKLSKIDIPQSVTGFSQGVSAFENTQWLNNQRKENTLVIVNNIVLDGQAARGVVTIPSGVKEIYESAFVDNDQITEMIISQGVEEIGKWAFSGCNNLVKIEIPTSVSKIGEGAFEDTKWYNNLPYSDSLLIVKQKLFACEKKLTGKVVIPYGVKEIGEGVFSYSDIEEIVIPESLEKIGKGAFIGCNNLKKVEIQGKVTSVGDYAFQNCENLKEINFPYGLETIGKSAFIFSGLEKIELPESVKEISLEAFYGTPWVKNKKNINALTIVNDILLYGGNTSGKIQIPDGVRVICDDAFATNKMITEVVIPGSVEVISNGAFEGCKNLKSVTIKHGVKCISDFAFSGTNISNITIPESVEELGNYVFKKCKKLKKVIIQNKKCKIDALGVTYNQKSLLKTVIHGYTNSTAHRYAIKENLKFKKLKK